MLLPFVLLGFVVPSFTQQLGNKSFEWAQLNLRHVCFECNGDRHGTIYNFLREPRLVAAMKLVYRSGEIRCTPNKAYNSRWGCHSGSKTPLNAIVTDQRNNVIYPRKEYLKDQSSLWYAMPVVDESYSDELVFTNFGVPFYLEKHRELRIWCGEDLKNKNDGDNQGRVCVDVYIKYY
ncbi:uncharacterized protein LOC111331130 [Stylophora pistillata]|uniref:CUB domain-containing protein n=1 Tax=Stylophora pistillata TaxID=50429 RepID=A0A2B4S5Y4_STYPI|nr:uncharacterized protein LOC111331130 [Stylophora pistillata]PFX24806.1 hypothetical protein AWC38_SpisGene10573 [Stylophora pistillata]